MQKATVKEIEEYLEGYDEQKYIVGIESNYYENKVSLIVHDPEKGKRIEKHKFRPFMWMKTPDVDKLYGGDRRENKKKMTYAGKYTYRSNHRPLIYCWCYPNKRHHTSDNNGPYYTSQ